MAERMAITVQRLACLRVVALRHLPGGASTVESVLAAQGLPPLPPPGCFEGVDPCLLWRSPGESLLIGNGDSAAMVADGLLKSLAPGTDPLACALDLSAGGVAFDLQGDAIESVLERLFDASAIPRQPGQGTRARLGDVAAIVMRRAAERVWLLADRSHEAHAAEWIERAVALQRCSGS